MRPRSRSNIHLLGFPERLRWNYEASRGLTVSLPDNLQDESHHPGQFAWAFKIETEN